MKMWRISVIVTTHRSSIIKLSCDGRYRHIEYLKKTWSTTTPSTLGERNLVNFGPQSKKFWRCILIHPSEHFARDYISPLRRYRPLKFLHALEIDQGLLAHTPTGMPCPPPEKNCKNLKFWPKIQHVSLCNSVTSWLVGISSTIFSRVRDELWFTNKKVIARILTYPNCTNTESWRKFIRHVVLYDV